MKATLSPVPCNDDEDGSSNPLTSLDLPSYVKDTVWNRAKAFVEDQSAMVIHLEPLLMSTSQMTVL